MDNQNMNVREFFKALRGKDKRSLTAILQICKSHDLDVIARGSTVDRGHNQNYKDIDLLVRGDQEDYHNAMSEIDVCNYMLYTPLMGPYVGEQNIRQRFKLGIFDICYVEGHIREDVPQVNLIMNESVRK